MNKLSDFLKNLINEEEEYYVLTTRLHSIQDSYDSLNSEIEESISSYRVFARQRALLLQSLRESINYLSSYSQSLRNVEPNRLNVKSILFQRLFLYIAQVLIRIL